MSTLDIVAEGEESVGTEANIGVLSDPCLLFLNSEDFGLLGEYLLPLTVSQNVLILIADINVDSVVTVCTSYVSLERKSHYLGVLSQPPVVSLLTCKTCAVDS